MDYLLTRSPVNKMAAVMVNQCRRSSELELNNLIEQRDQIKANATMWMREVSKGLKYKRKNNQLIRQANADLAILNNQLKPYDEWHRSNKPKDYEHAFREVVRRVFGNEIFKQIELQANSDIN